MCISCAASCISDIGGPLGPAEIAVSPAVQGCDCDLPRDSLQNNNPSQLCLPTQYAVKDTHRHGFGGHSTACIPHASKPDERGSSKWCRRWPPRSEINQSSVIDQLRCRPNGLPKITRRDTTPIQVLPMEPAMLYIGIWWLHPPSRIR